MLLSNQAPTSGRARFVAPAAIGMVFTFLWSGQLALASGEPQDKPHEEHAHEAHAGEHQITTTIEAKDGVIVMTQGADGQKAMLHTGKLDLEPGQQFLVSHGDGDLALVDALVRQDDAPIGIVVGEADDTLAAQVGEDKQRVVVVRSVVPGSRASKAGIQEHDVIVNVNGKAGNKQELIDHAKKALRAGQDVKVVVVRKGDRKPLVLRADGGEVREAEKHGVWMSGADRQGKVFGLTAPAGTRHRVWVEADGEGGFRVHELTDEEVEDHDEFEVLIEEMNDGIGLGGGAGGAMGQARLKAWKTEDGTVATFGHLDDGHHLHAGSDDDACCEDKSEVHVFGLGKDGATVQLKTNKAFRIHEDGEVHADGDAHVQVFGLGGGGGGVVRRKGDSGQVIELQLEVEGDEHGERVIELHLEDDELGKVLRNEVTEYYREVDPEDFHKEIQRALEVYESSRKDFTTQEELQKMKKLQLYVDKDAHEALEQARKALEGISDRELAERTKKALQKADLSLEKGDYRFYRDDKGFKTYELQEFGAVEVPRTKIEALKEELNATRKQLEVQRKQIEDLKHALEKLARERELR